MQRNEIMQRIIDLETEMFMSVNAEEAVPANTIPAFKEMRRMTYSVLSDKTWSPAAVNSYFEDIKKAMEEGRNLAEERYDNLYQNIGKGRLCDVEDSLK